MSEFETTTTSVLSTVPTVDWRKSTYSGNDNGCVEVANFKGACGVRDSKDRTITPFSVSNEVWASFLGFVTPND